MNENEIVSDQDMRAKKSGWDEAEKFYKAQFQEKVQEIFEWVDGRHKLGYLSHCGFLHLWQAFKEKTLKEM